MNTIDVQKWLMQLFPGTTLMEMPQFCKPSQSSQKTDTGGGQLADLSKKIPGQVPQRVEIQYEFKLLIFPFQAKLNYIAYHNKQTGSKACYPQKNAKQVIKNIHIAACWSLNEIQVYLLQCKHCYGEILCNVNFCIVNPFFFIN